MEKYYISAIFGLVGLLFSSVEADLTPLQDLGVAQQTGAVVVNELFCKDPGQVQAYDFSFGGLHVLGNTSNFLGLKVTPVFASQLPGLNTLGMSMARLDFVQWGVNPPHTHPRTSEIFLILEGTGEAGFVTSNPENRLISRTFQKGDMFVFPIGLIHYQRNVSYGNAVGIDALISQNPAVITVANGVFGSSSNISVDVLACDFQADKNVISQTQGKF